MSPYGVPRTEKERRERHKRLHPDKPLPKRRLGRGYGRSGRGYGRGRGYRRRARDDDYEDED